MLKNESLLKKQQHSKPIESQNTLKICNGQEDVPEERVEDIIKTIRKWLNEK
jgi:hypothetical protein